MIHDGEYDIHRFKADFTVDLREFGGFVPPQLIEAQIHRACKDLGRMIYEQGLYEIQARQHDHRFGSVVITFAIGKRKGTRNVPYREVTIDVDATVVEEMQLPPHTDE